jgi:hypothetical protein
MFHLVYTAESFRSGIGKERDGMNTTQKGAWIMLSGVLLSAFVATYVGSIILFGRIPTTPLGRIGPVSAVLIPLLVVGGAILLLTRRQSPAEPEADERDKMIVRKAVAASFVALSLLLAVVILILGITLGQTGSIPVYVLTIILYGVFLVAGFVYSVAILTQYGGTTKETSHE